MIVTLSGVTGTGKSFFKNVIAEELGFENLAIVTTRKKRANEIEGIDKEFVSDKEFDELVKNKEVTVNFEFLGEKYGYRTEKLESDENQVTEICELLKLGYSTKDISEIYQVNKTTIDNIKYKKSWKNVTEHLL